MSSIATALIAITLVLSGGCNQESPSPPAPVDTTAPIGTNEPRVEPPARGTQRSRTMYVPAYSHLRNGGNRPTLYSITLSVRNVDPTSTVKLTHVDYFDTSGHRVRRYLKSARELRPLETAEYFVESVDTAGGSGANFLVYWEGPSDAHPLLTEAVMMGFMGAGYTTFTSRGVELPRRPELDASSDAVPASSGPVRPTDPGF